VTVTPNTQDLSELLLDAPLNTQFVNDSGAANFYVGMQITSAYGFPGGSVPGLTISFALNDSEGHRPFDDFWTPTMSSEYPLAIVDFTGTVTSYSWTQVQITSGLYYTILSNYVMSLGDWDDFRPSLGYPMSPTKATLIAKIKMTFGYFAGAGPSNPQQATKEYYMQFRIG
jgi:hypothetical protein